MGVKRISIQGESEQEILYHGSPRVGLMFLSPMPSRAVDWNKVVFATACREIALYFAVRRLGKGLRHITAEGERVQWWFEDLDMLSKLSNHPPVSIYHVRGDDFDHLTSWDWELATPKRVDIVYEEVIDDPWDEIHRLTNERRMEIRLFDVEEAIM